jgi:hypothetical protein
MLDDYELDIGDLIACAIEYSPMSKQEGLHEAVRGLSEDRRGPHSWARDRLERRQLSRDMRARRARDRRMGKDLETEQLTDHLGYPIENSAGARPTRRSARPRAKTVAATAVTWRWTSCATSWAAEMSALRRLSPPPAPPRSPEREKLADAISSLAQAVYEADRVEAARQKLDDRYFDELQPAAEEAREALVEAEEVSPQHLVDAVLEGKISEDATAVARINLRQAEVAVEQARSARRVLENEAERAQVAIGNARQALDKAVQNVVQADPAKQAVTAEFFRTGRHLLRLARVIRTMGIIAQGVAAVDIGLVLRINDIIKPGSVNSTGASSFTRDPAWTSALAALREDADTLLPGLPPTDDDEPGECRCQGRLKNAMS